MSGAILIPAKLVKVAKPFKLTRREMEILTQSLAGDCVKTIADKMGISARAVVYHRQHCQKKIGSPTLAACAFALFF